MSSQWQYDHSLIDDDRFRKAVNLFNTREWYDAHDAFEELWHESVGEERAVFQGIIQIAVAEHHLRNGNWRGSLLLMAEGLNHLQASPPQDLGFDMHSLQAIVRQRLASLQTGQPLDGIPLPVLEPIVPGKD